MNDRTPPRGRSPRPARPVPAARPPARVFWVRRLVVLGIPLLLVVVLAVWWTGRGGDAQADVPTAPVTTPGSDPDTGAGIPDCAPAQLALAVTPVAESFPAGTEPLFEVSVTNSGPEPCLVDAGDGQREVVITSGEDRVWSSLDCVPPEADPRTLLLVGGQSDVTQLGWARLRSAAGCAADLPAPGEGTYSVTVAMGGALSPAAVFGLG